MGLFKLENHVVTIDPEVRLFPQLKKIVTRDKDRFKKQAMSELAYIYFMYDHRSPFAIFSKEKRFAQVIKQCKLESTWKEDDDIRAAVTLYNKLQFTPAVKSLINTKEALLTSSDVVEKLRSVIEKDLEDFSTLQSTTLEILSVEDYDSQEEFEDAVKANLEIGREARKERKEAIKSLVDQVNMLLAISEKLPTAISTVESLEEKVKQEQSISRKTRGDAGVGAFEEY